MADHAPQQPGNMKIDLAPGRGSIEIDGYPLDQFITRMRLEFDAKTWRPVLYVELLPSVVNITGPGVDIRGDFRDFLIAHGWRPPG